MRTEFTIALERNTQQNQITTLRNIINRLVLSAVVFLSEDELFTFAEIARHSVLFRPG